MDKELTSPNGQTEYHVLRDAGLSDLEAELEQLAMDTEARKI